MNSRPPFALRLLPSLQDVVLLSPIAFVLARVDGAKTLLGDGDTGWHIQTGEWILRNAQIPATDLFSYTKAGTPWFAWEWLWDVAFALLHRAGGMAGVLFGSLAVLCAAFSLLYSMTRKHSGNALLSAAVTLTAVVASSFHWLARPHLVTLLFLVFFYRVAEGASRKQLLSLLPCAMVLWTNLHGGFIAGLMLLGTYAAGEFIGSLLLSAPDARHQAQERAVLFLQSFLLCALATVCNPYGYTLHQHVFSYLTDGYQLKNIEEFQSISFHHPLSRAFEFLLVLGIAAAFQSLAKKEYKHFLLLLLWAHLALLSGRNIPIFAIFAAPLIARSLQEALQAAQGKLAAGFARFCGKITAMEATPRWHLASAAGLVLSAALMFAPAPAPRFVSEYNPHDYPERALASLKTPAGSGNIFTTDLWAGYLIYRWSPTVRVFIDGRSDFYGPQLGDEYTNLITVKPGWEAALQKHGIHTVLLPATSVLSSALKESKNWRCFYDDGTAIVFRPAAQAPPEDNKVSATLQSGGTSRDVAASGSRANTGSTPGADRSAVKPLPAPRRRPAA